MFRCNFVPQSSRISQLLGRRCEFLITASRRCLCQSVKWIFIWILNYILFDIFATKNRTTARRRDWFLSPTQSQPASLKDSCGLQSCFCALSRFYYARAICCRFANTGCLLWSWKQFAIYCFKKSNPLRLEKLFCSLRLLDLWVCWTFLRNWTLVVGDCVFGDSHCDPVKFGGSPGMPIWRGPCTT